MNNLPRRTLRVLATSAAFGPLLMLGLSGGAMAQTAAGAPESGAAQAQSTERIEITGSRIKSLTADSPSPLQVLTSLDIEASGVLNLQDLLLKNPTVGTPSISRTNSNFSTASAGVSTVDLRNLGTARTLVLVNGRRFVSGLPGFSAVDLNTIPTDFVERVDLLTGGASSTYGSDAVAGVVNLVLKRNFQGFVVDASKGQSAKSDDKRDKVSLTMGINAPEGKGNLMAHFGYTKQGAVFSAKRDISAVDQASRGEFITGDPADIFTVQRPFFSSFAPQGRVFISPGVNSQSRTFNSTGGIIPWSTNGPAGDGVGATGYNRSAIRTIAIPLERFIFSSKGDYNLSDELSVYFEGTYAGTKASTQLEPLPLQASDIYPGVAAVPAEFRINGALVRNPLITDGIYNLLGAATNADGARLYGFSKRLGEVANRGSTADRTTFRIVTGAKGSVFGKWDYDLYAIYGSTGESQVGNGQVNVSNFRNALEAIPGPGGTPICRDPIARAQGCVPINVFGFGAITPAAANYVSAPSSLSTLVTQRILAASISGEVFSLPAGPLGVAAGFENRRENSRSEFDALTQAGLNAGNAQPSTKGAFDVTEYYAELRAPLLKNAPAAHSLAVTAAIRGAKYSTVGSTTSWNTGLEWEPVRSIKVRATGAQSTRAPNIDELFSPPQQTFPTGISDPCVGVTATSTTAASVACRAAPGVNANIAANGGVFTLTQADQQGISGFNRGNPGVKQEVGKSMTFGLVFTPTMAALRGFTFSVDYFDIKIDDAIVPTPRQFILQQCYTGDASFCQFITRRPNTQGANNAGSLSFIDSTVTNSGALATKGVDLTAAYSGKVGSGDLRANVTYTRLQDGYLIPLKGSDKDHFAGEIGAARDRAVLTVGYKWQGFGVSTQTTYIGKSSLDDQFLAKYDLARDALGVKAKVYNDLQVSYDWKKARVYLGVDNAFGVKPPVIPSGLPSNVTGAETAADVYDAIGRRWYVGARFTF